METEFEEKTIDFIGKEDEKFVNDKITTLRRMRDDYQTEINNVSKNLKHLQDKKDSIQEEIDQEFLKQEHAYDLVGKCVLCKTDVYHVKNVERLFDGVRICSDWSYDIQTKTAYCSPYKIRYCTISFNELSTILSENKFIPIEEATESFKQYMLK